MENLFNEEYTPIWETLINIAKDKDFFYTANFKQDVAGQYEWRKSS